jgi:hypothetical protein
MVSTHVALRVAAVAAVAAASSLLPAQAHHSYGMFDQCTATTLEGEVNSIEWVNPHIVLYLRTRDVDNYRIEWYSLLQLQRERIATETLKAGDRVTITGHAMRDPNLKVLSLLSEIRGPAGWAWARTREPPASCAAG